MLEQSSLLVHDWTQEAEPDGGLAWMRPITDNTGRALGFVRLAGNPRGSWFSWLRSVRLDVYETDDASHLMSVSRSWGMLGSWEVDDAEDRHVGTILANCLLSSDGQSPAVIDRESPERGRLFDSALGPLAGFGKRTAGVEVTFAPSLNPFMRMLVLGCVLAEEPGPNR